METREMKLDLPGFRFHPTEEELLDFYLRNVVQGKINFDIIPSLNIYRYSPWQLPGLAKIGEREWYFFVPRDRKSGNGGRPNRTTERGFWKATGSDRQIRSLAEPKRVIGVKKTLVFYMGRAPRGTKTDWVMNEYRLPDSINIPLKDIVLCKIYRKATSLKELEQRAALEEDMISTTPTLHCVVRHDNNSPSTSDHEWNPSSSSLPELDYTVYDTCNVELLKEAEVTYKSVIIRPSAVALTELQVPSSGFELGLEWMQDPLFTQQSSQWLDQWSPNATFVNF